MAATNVGTTTSLLLAENLDDLPGHINSVLIQLGKLLRHQSRLEHKVTEKQKFQAHEALAKITRQFHESLDEAEHEILNAKAVVERDHNNIRAKQIERENAQRAVASQAGIMTDANQSQDIAMQGYPEAAPVDTADPDETLVDLDTDQVIPESEKVHTYESQDGQSGHQSSQGLKDISLDDDDLFSGGADAFGPDSGDPNFDFTAGGDFDMDFSMPAEATNAAATSTQSAPDPVVSTDPVAPETLADNDLLLHDFGDVNATGDMHTNGFGDIDFDHVDTTQDETASAQNPFGSINTDDDFDSFFDMS